MNYRNILPLVSHTQAFSTDYWNDFGYWNDGTFWYEKTPTYTARVTAYAAATGITDYTILDPLNIFDLGLTYYGLDTIMKAVYPMVTDKTSQSDMANQMKYNFMNPLDTNPAFRLNWVGGWIYSRTGALPNGTNAYANTNLIPSTALAGKLNNTHLSFYSRTNNPASEIADMGSLGSNNNWTLIEIYQNLFYNLINQSVSTSNSSMTNSTGIFIGSRTANNILKSYKNSNLIATFTTSSNSLSNISLTIGAMNRSTTPIYYSSRQYAFASIGDGLTDFQADIFSTLVNNLQKALNRAVY